MTETSAIRGDGRRAALEAAQAKAQAMFDAIEAAGIIQPGKTETEVEAAIYALAEADFGVVQHWHKRIIRAGPNTLTTFADLPEVRTIEPDDTVYVDLGPVFEAWEADIGRTYALGPSEDRGHLVGEFPHAVWPGERDPKVIWPANPWPMRAPDHLGRERHWILEIHLVD